MADGEAALRDAAAEQTLGVLVLDASGRVASCDEAACGILLTDRDEVLGEPLTRWAPEVADLGEGAPATRRVVQVLPSGRGAHQAELIAGALGPQGRTVMLAPIGMGHAAEPRRELSEREHDFLLALNARLRSAGRPDVILGEAAEMLGRHLGVGRVGYGEVDPEAAFVEVQTDWHDGVMGSLRGRLPLPPSVSTSTSYGRGATLVVDDYRRLDNMTPEELEGAKMMGIVGSITVPLVKDGRLVALMAAQQSTARSWTAAEVWLVEEVADRIWAALERARADARRRDSEAQFRTLAENMPDICWVADADGGGFWCNRRGQELFGGARDRAPTIGEKCHPDDRAAIRRAAAQALAEGSRYEAVVRYRDEEGVYRPFLSRAEPVKDETGRVVQWCGVLTDLSEQNAAKQRLQLLQQLSEALRDQTDAEVILSRTVELLGGSLDASRVCYSEADEPGADLMRIVHTWTDGAIPDLGRRQRHSSLGSKVVSHHRRGLTLVVDDTADHPMFPPEVVGPCHSVGYRAGVDVPLVKDGRLVAFLSVHQSTPRKWTAHEVTLIEEIAERTWAALERARAEHERQESQAVLAAITEHAPIGIYLRDHRGRYLLANPETARVIGRPTDEVVGRAAADLLPPDLAAVVVERDREVLETGKVTSYEAHRPGRDAYEWSLVMRFPVSTAPDGPTQVAGFDIDITAQKQAQAELKRSQEALHQSEKLAALGSLLAGVSHELNNPLSIIVAQSVMMERHAAGTPLAERAAKIRKAADRSARIVQTFLAMARQKRPERKRVDLNEVVSAALELTEYSLRSGGVQLERDLAADLPPLWADADQLHQVVVNLVINAQQAMADQQDARRLSIRTRREGDAQVVIEIADTGPGVPEDIRRRIFEPFFTTKPQTVGTGVGLSFSQGLVEAHGGRLELLESETGATFRATIPARAVDLQTSAGEPGAPAAAPPLRRTALIIDDEADIAEALADLLELEGYLSEIAIGGRAGQARLAADGARFDMIVSDLRMPDLDGPALFAWMQAERPELTRRLAFSTGDTLGVSAVRFLAKAACPCVEKPFTPESLHRLVQEVDARREIEVSA